LLHRPSRQSRTKAHKLSSPTERKAQSRGRAFLYPALHAPHRKQLTGVNTGAIEGAVTARGHSFASVPRPAASAAPQRLPKMPSMLCTGSSISSPSMSPFSRAMDLALHQRRVHSPVVHGEFEHQPRSICSVVTPDPDLRHQHVQAFRPRAGQSCACRQMLPAMKLDPWPKRLEAPPAIGAASPRQDVAGTVGAISDPCPGSDSKKEVPVTTQKMSEVVLYGVG